MSLKIIAGAVLALGMAASLATASAATSPPIVISGAGSTFVEPVMTKWAADFAANPQTGGAAKIVYQSVGSGAGIERIKSRQVDFGASDKPLPPEELAKDGLVQFPIVVGGVVPVVNLPGVKSGDLHLTGPVLANIYLGKIVRWNDPAIVKLNRAVRLPNAPILVVHRSDGSGTTFNWTNYLAKQSAEWRSRAGEGTSVNWPAGDGENGNEGVAAKVSHTPQSIGYVEYAFVARHNLTWAYVLNRANRDVEPNVFSFQVAAEGANFSPQHGFYAVLTDTAGINAYPIAATTFILMPKQGDPAKRRAILQFLGWALDNGREDAAHLGYVPLPRSLATDVQSYWATAFGHP